MADVFGVDLDEAQSPGSIVITAASVPASVVQNAEMARKLAARREWRARQARGEVPDDATPPPGPSDWELAIEPAITGVGVLLVVGLLVHVVAGGLGHLFGFHPGPLGWWIGIPCGLLAGAVVWTQRDSIRTRDAARLAANQRVISDPLDKWQMTQAHTAAVSVSKLWPHLPVQAGSPEPRLRSALWYLSGELLERRRYAETLADLRQNAVGVPATVPTASDVAVRIKRAETRHREHDAAARAWLEDMKALAAACQRLYDAQVAIGRARAAKRRADAAFRTLQVADRPLAEDIGALTEEISAVVDGYRRLAPDASDSSD